jgi:hypothetical protein
MQVDSKHPKVVYAHGNVALLDVVEYVRRRVSRTDIRQEAGRFVFERVSLNEGDATQFFRLELFEREGMTHLTMRDLSQPPSTPGLSEQERRRRAGLLEDGRVDPELK